MTDTTPESHEALPKQAGHGHVTWLIILVLVIQITMVAFYMHRMGIGGINAASGGSALDMKWVDDVNNALREQEERLEEIGQSTPAGDGVNPQEIAALDSRIAELTARVEELASLQLSDARLDELRSIKNTLEATQRAMKEEAGIRWQAIQLQTSFDAMRSTMLHGKPYLQHLDAFSIAAMGMAQRDTWVAELKPHAESGIASHTQLTQSLADAIRAHQTQSKDAGDSTFAAITTNLTSLITVRKVGVHEGDDTASRIARAEVAVNSGKLSEAVAELSALASEDKTYYDAWIAHAQQRIASEKTLHIISLAVQEIMMKAAKEQ